MYKKEHSNIFPSRKQAKYIKTHEPPTFVVGETSKNSIAKRTENHCKHMLKPRHQRLSILHFACFVSPN